MFGKSQHFKGKQDEIKCTRVRDSFRSPESHYFNPNLIPSPSSEENTKPNYDF